MTALFGTDGIRGETGKFPLTRSEVVRIGLAAGHVLRQKFPTGPVRVMAVRDTRGSGPSLLKYLSEGLRSQGVDVFDAGVLCTPSVALLVRQHKFQSGVVISASHNPPQFNGIKFFSNHSRKWPDEWEREVEQLFDGMGDKKPSRRILRGQFVQGEALHEDYQDFVIQSLGAESDLTGLRIALDCANGANSDVAPRVFKKCGATVFISSAKPNGKNINVSCGSQHTERLSKLVKAKKCDAGIAFDGDGDRVIFVDEKGREMDGDYLIAILTKDFKARGILKKNVVVVTVMANLGLRKALSHMGVRVLCTAVGDRFVSQAMKTSHAVLGGEQSGHIILGKHLPTGDGLLTSLHVLAAMKRARKPLSHLASVMRKFPQILLNVPVKSKIPVESLNGVGKRIKSIEKSLGDEGRVVVRYSGTEPLLRIMMEGPDSHFLKTNANEIARLVLNAQK